MQVFDGKNHGRGGYDRIALDVIVDKLNGDKHWGWINFPPTSEHYTPEERLRADAMFLSRLRSLVDEWIASGIDEKGIETPSSRYVRPTVKGDAESLFDILHGWLNRNMPRPVLSSDGKIGIVDQKPHFRGFDLDTYAREVAIYYLKELLECPAPSRLGKCRNCKTYFARRRERKGAIKRGTYCGSCELIGAAERTRLSRQRRKEQQLYVAAEAWPRWAKSNRHPDKAAWVAQQVNGRIRTGHPIQAKWVVQNRAGILARLRQFSTASR